MKYFCSKCGKTTQYNFELPKFCAFCGQSFANTSASQTTEQQRSKFLNELKSKKINDLNTYNEIETTDENANINFKNIKAKYKLDIYKPQGDSFGDLIDNPKESVPMNNSTTNIKSKEDILSEFQKEAGAIRSK